ncbi:hypothetical protein DTO271G3_645 [Paecilomyces variotii]|nr:hypothetical protein DTO271G3_645 [Paecilomyces variotii]
MRPSSPHQLLLGTSQPPNEAHAVSVSLPTWHSIVSWSRREPWVVSKMQSGYPRLYINDIIQKLSSMVLQRLHFPSGTAGCMLFPSIPAARRLIASLTAKGTKECISPYIEFSVPESLTGILNDHESRWATFYAVVYHPNMVPEALSFWRETGDGITSRHAQFIIAQFQYLESKCTASTLCTSPSPSPIGNLCDDHEIPGRASLSLPAPAITKAEVAAIKSLLIDSATLDTPNKAGMSLEDVFLYPKGLCGIYAVARSLVPEGPEAQNSQVVIYGWPYAETVKCVERSGWGNVILYGKGTDADLDNLEKRLENGERIQLLFCELPSNPQLASPDLNRIRELADRYKFVVACDETLGTFVNVNILPLVDIAMTSLTKIFSGASDVMGGSVLVNPQSPFYKTIRRQLSDTWEDILFPGDVSTLAKNCPDFVERVQYSSRSALAVAILLSQHHLVQTVNYPPLTPTRHLYERYRRKDGGYGYVLSIIFYDPEKAVAFYDALDVCKGTSIGANFTLAVPYAQLAHFRELDLAEENGVPRHIIRISVGIDDTEKLLDRVRKALVAAERLPEQMHRL